MFAYARSVSLICLCSVYGCRFRDFSGPTMRGSVSAKFLLSSDTLDTEIHILYISAEEVNLPEGTYT